MTIYILVGRYEISEETSAFILSRVLVSTDGVRIGNWIY
jgi:hypothetical protein